MIEINLADNLKTAFDSIRAEEKLKSVTIIYLQSEIKKKEEKRKEKHKYTIYKKFAAVFAAVIFLSGVFSYNLYYTPAAYVSMDVNPSLELTLNRFNRVIEANPYNDDGAVILQNINLRYKASDEAVQVLLDSMISQGYLSDDGLISITVAAVQKKQAKDSSTEKKLLDDLQRAVDFSLNLHHSEAETDLFAVTQEVRHNAQDNSVSPAKYIAITELQEVDPTATFESCGHHSIKEIRRNTQEHSNNYNSGQQPESDFSGHHHGGRPQQTQTQTQTHGCQ